jgi:DNA-binding NarL/FixJ family response regulator
MAKKRKTAWRVLIVDDHPVVREGIRMCLKDHREVELVGEAANGAEALELIKELSPDVALLDLVMPRMSGLEALPGIRRARPKLKVIIFTYHNTREQVREALAAHVDGYLLKDSSPEEYVEAIRKVMAGNFFISTAAAGHLDGRRLGKAPLRFGLKLREHEYLCLAARGDRPPQIARAMGCSEGMARTYRVSVFKKLGVKNMAELTRFALENGL